MSRRPQEAACGTEQLPPKMATEKLRFLRGESGQRAASSCAHACCAAWLRRRRATPGACSGTASPGWKSTRRRAGWSPPVPATGAAEAEQGGERRRQPCVCRPLLFFARRMKGYARGRPIQANTEREPSESCAGSGNDT